MAGLPNVFEETLLAARDTLWKDDKWILCGLEAETPAELLQKIKAAEPGLRFECIIEISAIFDEKAMKAIEMKRKFLEWVSEDSDSLGLTDVQKDIVLTVIARTVQAQYTLCTLATDQS